MPSYRPSAVAILAILWDEQRQGLQAPPQFITGSPLVQLPNSTGLRTVSDTPAVKAIQLQPLSCEYSRNSAKTADTAKCRFAWLDVPIAGEAIRAAEFALCMDNVENSQITGESLSRLVGAPTFGDRSPSIINPSEANTRFLGVLQEWDENIDEGYIDASFMDFTAILQRQIPVSKEDGTKIDPPIAISKKLPLEIGVQQLVNTIPLAGGRLNVWVQLDSDRTKLIQASGPQPFAAIPFQPTGVLPAPQDYHPKVHGPADQHHLSAHKMTYWEHITEVCQQGGFIPYVYLDKVIISTARFIYDDPSGQNPPAAPVMVYGQNLSSLRFKRRFGAVKTPMVEVRAWCPDTIPPSVLVGRYPPIKNAVGVNAPANPTAQTLGGQSDGLAAPPGTMDPMRQQGSTVDVIQFVLPPLSKQALRSQGPQPFAPVPFAPEKGLTPSVLDRVAENAYFAIAKNTISGSLSTEDTWSVARPKSATRGGHDISQFEGQRIPGIANVGPSNPDLYKLATGDPIQIAIRGLRADEADGPPAMLFAGFSEEEIVQYLVKRRNFANADVARALAQYISHKGNKNFSRTTVFRVRTVNVRAEFAGASPSLSITIDFTDFVQAHDHPQQKVATNLSVDQAIRPGGT